MCSRPPEAGRSPDSRTRLFSNRAACVPVCLRPEAALRQDIAPRPAADEDEGARLGSRCGDSRGWGSMRILVWCCGAALGCVARANAFAQRHARGRQHIMFRKLTATARHVLLPLTAVVALSGCSTESYRLLPDFAFGKDPAQFCAPGGANLCGYTAVYRTDSHKWYWCYISHTQELDDCSNREEMTPKEAVAYETAYHSGSSFFKR